VSAVLLSTLLVAAVPGCCAAAYLLLLALLSRRLPEPTPAAGRPFFSVVVPAHDEEAGIGATVASLLALDWPADRFEVCVVADNCSDLTADRASAAGARVLVRRDEQLRGKGYALAHAYETLLAEGRCDALVVIDADTVVSRNLLASFAVRLEAGECAIQADYAVRNPGASWRTRLMAVALGAFHVLRSRARERLGISCVLHGNGMCFAAALLREVPHDAYSVVEDIEYSIRICSAGKRVAYADEAHVYGEMVSAERASRSQRRRWDQGRVALARSHGRRLLADGVRRRSLTLFDHGVDLLVPPLSRIVGWLTLGLAVSCIPAIERLSGRPPALAFAAGLAAVALYVLRGWALSGTGWRGLRDLLFSPVYVGWKVALAISQWARPARSGWVRTARERKVL
jgi:1,2-diacylglycerol 3-beta-glucosyltransferase